MRNGVVIAGYYGANNTGDEAILTGIIEAHRSQGITDITVLSRNPKQTTEIHDVKSVYIGRRFDGLIQIYQLLRKSELFILGGGGLLQDYTSRVVPYWLSRVIIALAAGTPVMYYAHGVGPLRTDLARRLVKLISNRVKRITVRDNPSYELLKEIGVTKPKLEITADPALNIKVTSNGLELLKQAGADLQSDTINIGVALRTWKGQEEYLPVLIKALKQLTTKTKIHFYFFPFQTGEDEEVSKYIMKEIDNRSVSIIEGTYTPEQMTAMLKALDGVLAMRLHAIILSSISRVPSFGLVYDPKVYNFMKRLGLEGYSYQIEEMAAKEEPFIKDLTSWVDELDSISKQMDQPVQDMINQSMKNAIIAKEIMNKG